MIFIREYGGLLAAKGGKEKAGPRVKERLPLINGEVKEWLGILWSMGPVLSGSLMIPEK